MAHTTTLRAAGAALSLLCMVSCGSGARRLDGQWVGGWQRESTYHFVDLALKTEDGSQSGRIALPLEPEPKPWLMNLSWDDKELTVELLRKDEPKTFLSGKLERGDASTERVVGNVKNADWSGEFELTRTSLISRETLDKWVGEYAGEGGTLRVRRDGAYLLASYNGEPERALFPDAVRPEEDAAAGIFGFRCGAAAWLPHPPARRFRFRPGAASSVIITDAASGAKLLEAARK